MRLHGPIVMVGILGLLATGCTDAVEPPTAVPSASSAPSTAAMTSAAFEEAYEKLPMDGTQDMPITWDIADVPDSDEVLAARRGLVFFYWQGNVTDWTSIVPNIGRFTATDNRYQQVLSRSAHISDSDGASEGPIWVKAMGVESTGEGKAMVTFCADLGHFLGRDDGEPYQNTRANLESYLVTYAPAGDGQRRWLVDAVVNNADEAEDEKYGAECEQWAQHTP